MTERHKNWPRTGSELKAMHEAVKTGLPFVYWRDGTDSLRFLMLEPELARVTIGRRESADIALPWDGEVSRLHATLNPAGDDWSVVDEDSTNGTWVNGSRVNARKRLSNKDHLILGETRVDYCGADHGSVSTARAAGSSDGSELPPRKRKVLIELCRPIVTGGASTPATNPQIAAVLHMALDTVKGIMKELFEQFGLTELAQNEKRAKLVSIVLDRKLLAPHDF